MANRDARIVYSTDKGSVCPGCGWPLADCQCSSQRAGTAAIPSKIVAKLRMEKKGRGGKTVTVLFDLPHNEAFLKALCQDLKKTCGTGGAVAGNAIELQGEQRERVRDLLLKKGYTVKG